MQLDLERATLWPHTPLRAALASYLPFSCIGASTYVLESWEGDEHTLGFVQARRRPGRPEWDVVYLAPSLSRAAQAVWVNLLNYLCTKAGEQGTQRLFAKLTTAGVEAEAFRQAGFSPYAGEQIFRRDANTLPSSSPLRVRLQRTTDAWGLQRLYANCVPRPVQQIEGEVGSEGRLGIIGGRGYVLEEQGEIVGYLQVVRGAMGHWLKITVHPQSRDQADGLVRDGLALLGGSLKPIYSSLREYEADIRGALADCGFEPVGERSLWVKHTTVRVREPAQVRRPVLEAKAEPVRSVPNCWQERGLGS
jgi:hypothetical protein